MFARASDGEYRVWVSWWLGASGNLSNKSNSSTASTSTGSVTNGKCVTQDMPTCLSWKRRG